MPRQISWPHGGACWLWVLRMRFVSFAPDVRAVDGGAVAPAGSAAMVKLRGCSNAVPLAAVKRPLDGLAGVWLKAAAVLLGVSFLVAGHGGKAMAQGYVHASPPSGLGGYFQGLFGSPHQVPALPVPPLMPLAMPRPSPPAYPQSRTPGLALKDRKANSPAGQNTVGGAGARNAAASLGGGLRTMCVRLCDGYYWPMTFDANRSRVGHDAKVCSAACTSEARVFIMPKAGVAQDMVDQQGRPYAKLANAFKYRKAQTSDCSCRPDPWDGEARARHATFAERASAERALQVSAAPIADAALAADDASGGAATMAVKSPTMADAEALAMSGGGMEHGLRRGARVAAAKSGPTDAPAKDAAPGETATAPPATTNPGIAVLAAADKVGGRVAKATAAKPASEAAKGTWNADLATKSQIHRVRTVQPARTSSFMVGQRGNVQGGYAPTAYGLGHARPFGPARQPYVIVQPQGVPYRTY